MHIGYASPLSLARLAPFLDGDVPSVEEGPSYSDLIRQFIDLGHTVTAFSLSPAFQKTTEFCGPKLRVIMIPMRHSGRTRNFYQTEVALLKEAYRKSNDLDVLHTNWLHEYTHASNVLKVPRLVTAHDAPFVIARYQRPIKFWLARALYASYGLSKVKRLAVLSPYLAAYFKKYHRFSGAIDIIPECTATDAYLLDQGKTQESNKPITIAAILNGFNLRKNSITLIKAFAEHRKTYRDSRLILFGHGHGPDQEADAWARENSCADNIDFAGATLNDTLLRRLNREIDIVVHPALEEAFGIAVADSLAMGKPVIGGRGCGAVPWVLGGGKAGLLVNMRDVSDLAAGINLLAGDSSLRIRMAVFAKEYANENFHISKVAHRYCQIYSELLVAI